jgi:S-(hydroxymethyl)glutathione dehydrogenase/alcohol dehydrogenase
MCGISTFSQYTVASVDSTIKIDKDLPLDKACLVGCGVGTGWGSAVNSAEVRARRHGDRHGHRRHRHQRVQGAAHAGATNVIAVDPVAFKREKAMELGATHAVATMEEATELGMSMTNGQGADSAIVTVGVTTNEHVGQAFNAIRKAGTCVVTGLGNLAEEPAVPISIAMLTLVPEAPAGLAVSARRARARTSRGLQMYADGVLKLDELVTRTYTLDEITQGYKDLHAGTNLRGVIIYD